MTHEIRSVAVGEVDLDTRTITGIAVPYGEVTTRVGYPEMFEAGSIADGSEAPLHVNHGGVRSGSLPIGSVRGTSTPAGYRIEATVARTARGDEVLELCRAGVLKFFSIGFVPIEHVMRGDTVVRKRVELREVSIVERPAYEGAVIQSVRSAATEKDSSMDPEQIEALRTEMRDEYATQITDLERRLATTLDSRTPAGRPTFQARSGGEFLKALARGDQAVIEEYRTAVDDLETRAYEGSTTADGADRPAWIDRILRLTDRKRPLSTLFRREPLPAAGNSYEYPYVKSETGTVQVQANEGDDLAFLKIALGTDSAPVRTVGGYTSLSRQAIERASVAWLDTALRWLTIQYAENYELMVRLFVEQLPVTNADPRLAINRVQTATKPAKAVDWILAAFDAGAAIEDNSKGLTPDFILVDRTVAKDLISLTDANDRPVFAVGDDGVNTWGDLTIQPTQLVGKINQLPVIYVPRLSTPTFTVASRDAVTTMESAGAPVRLEDENIINLTKDFSLYGYQSIHSEERKGISRVTWPAGGGA